MSSLQVCGITKRFGACAHPWLLVLAALPLLAPVARAGDETQRFGTGLEGRVWSPWPETAQKGWAPIFVELSNESQYEQTVEVEARCVDWNSERKVRTSTRIAPGASVALELLVPLGGDYNNEYTVLLRSRDGTAYFGDTVGSGSANPGFRQVLLLTESEPEAGAVERWSASLSTEALEQEHRSITMAGGTVMMSSHGRLIGAGTPAGPTPNDVDVAHARFAAMPRHHAAYSSLDLVVLDPARGMPSEEQLAGLLAWVRTGGDLLVIGEDARTAARTAPALAAWMEPRFEAHTRQEGGAGAVQYRCGLGRLFLGDRAGGLDDSPYVERVRHLLSENASLTPKTNGAWRGDSLTTSIPGLVQLPYRSFAALLLLFALVIGPVNFLAVRKRKNPVLLLLTIPAIALITTVALLAYGILFQGIDVKSASHSVAVLDQREHRSACVESRQFFAGLSPAVGLALGPGTIVHPVPSDTGTWAGRRLQVELEGGMLLGGDFLPSRRTTNQVLAVERAERARLEVRRSGSGLRVDNNLGATVQELLVRDPEGVLYLLAKPLAPGASAEMPEPTGERALDSAFDLEVIQLLGPPAMQSWEAVPPACFLARLERSPFRDACGIEMNELASAHVVLGVLPLEPEAWR